MSDPQPAAKELPTSDAVQRAFDRFDAGEVTDAEVQLLRSAIEARCSRSGIPSPFASAKAQRQREYDRLHMPSTHRADRRAAQHFAATAGGSNPWPAPVKRETIADKQFSYDIESRFGHLGADVIAEANRLRDEHRQLAEKVGTRLSATDYVNIGIRRFVDAEERQARRNRTDDLGAAELERHRANSRWHLPGDAQN